MRGQRQLQKRNFLAMKLQEAMQLLGRETLIRWQIESSPRPPSDYLLTHFRHLEVFELQNSEQAKTLLIDALFAEVVADYPKLKVWKAETLETDTLTGVADYLMAPHRAYMATPFLCVTEAKRDDFEKGRVQCIAEMYACQWNNRQSGQDIVVYGIVSNGQGWQFYKLEPSGDAFETDLYAIASLPELLGVLDVICAACAANVP